MGAWRQPQPKKWIQGIDEGKRLPQINPYSSGWLGNSIWQAIMPVQSTGYWIVWYLHKRSETWISCILQPFITLYQLWVLLNLFGDCAQSGASNLCHPIKKPNTIHENVQHYNWQAIFSWRPDILIEREYEPKWVVMGFLIGCHRFETPWTSLYTKKTFKKVLKNPNKSWHKVEQTIKKR